MDKDTPDIVRDHLAGAMDMKNAIDMALAEIRFDIHEKVNVAFASLTLQELLDQDPYKVIIRTAMERRVDKGPL